MKLDGHEDEDQGLEDNVGGVDEDHDRHVGVLEDVDGNALALEIVEAGMMNGDDDGS
jgi:hypothetical protein